MMRKTKIGLLPLYIKLYDDTRPEVRPAFEPFLQGVTDGFERAGIAVVRADVCRLAAEVRAALGRFQAEAVDAVVTLHLAYSPSGESIEALCGTPLPLLMLDTTMDFDHGTDSDPARLMFNHGIHGVQDLASVLRRRGRPFAIVAGHVSESDVLARAAAIVRAARAAREFRATRALRIGESFEGMGDFAVAPAVLAKAFGIAVDEIPLAALAAAVEAVSEAAVEAELAADRAAYDVRASRETHARSVRVGLGLRRHLEAGGYTAFSMNFLSFDSDDGPLCVVPFLEASKAMARGIGYAGEGDTLTAALVGALQRGLGESTFTEMFCPDWKGNTLFLSHMGEVNPELAAARPLLLEKDFPFTSARNPAYLACGLKAGRAVFANLSPGPRDSFRLILAPVEMQEDSRRADRLTAVRGWMKPAMPIGRFLEEYSRLGGTHHAALVYGDRLEALQAFATFAGMECRVV